MEKKMKLIERLVRDGHIGLDEALMLLESEKEYVNVPIIPTSPYRPLPPWDTNPINPYKDFPKRWNEITYGKIETLPQ